MREPKGIVSYNGRALKPSDTPMTSMEAEEAWEDAQEDNEEAVIQVDFTVPLG